MDTHTRGKHKSLEQVIIMIITTRWSDHIQENKIKVKSRVGTYQLQSCYFRSKDPEQWWLSENSWSRQGKIPAAQKISEISSSILVRELIVSPHNENPGSMRIFLRAFERTTRMKIPSTLKFTNTLPYAWKCHRIDNRTYPKRGFDWQHTTEEHLSSVL